MKYFLLATAFLLGIIYFSVNKAEAGGLVRGSGGRIITSYTAGVVCPGVGPVTIVPVMAGIPPYPYYLTPTSVALAGGRIPTANKNWLASYPVYLTPGLCYTTSTPPVPVPVYSVIRYGVSK